MKRILILAAVSLLGAVANAQTISPVWIEGKTKGFKSQFSVTNNSVKPLPVTVETREMVLIDGKPTLVQPTAGVHIELRDTSAVIQARQQRTFDYKVSADHEALVLFLAGVMSGQKTKEGVMVKLWFDHAVYVCSDSAKDCRVRVKKSLHLE